MREGIEFGGKNISIVPNGVSSVFLADIFIKEFNKRQCQDPFFITNLSTVHSQLQKWQKLMPGIQPHYAIKVDPDPIIIKFLAHLGVNFDCASLEEMQSILDNGLSGEQMVLSHNVKPISAIKFAKVNGVKILAYDNSEELKKIKETFPEAKLLLRLRVENNENDMAAHLGARFGCGEKDILGLLQEAADLQLDVVGASFHAGYLSENPELAYGETIRKARIVFDEAGKLGFSCKLLDIGGGYPAHCNQELSLEKIACEVHRALHTYFEDLRRNVRIMSEPGKYFSDAATTLNLSVVGKKPVFASDITKDGHKNEKGFFYWLNNGCHSAFPSFLLKKSLGWQPTIKIYGNKPEEKYWSILFGQTCDPMDTIQEEVQLPELNVGDWLIFKTMGASTRACHSNFNGFLVPETYYVVEEKDVHLLGTQ